MTISRRSLFKVLGVGAGVAACKPQWKSPADEKTSLAREKPYVPGAEGYATGEERWFKSSCGQCAASCGVRVRVVEGRAVRVEGDRTSPVNQGGIGARGLSALQALYDADRLTGPMARVGGKLVPISWDAATAELGKALAALRAAGTPERLLVWTGLERGPMHELLARFARAYGTPNFVDGRPGRTGALAQAMDATFGQAEVPVWGWDRATYVLSLEAGLVEDSCQSVYFTRVAAARRRNANRTHLVHAGPMLDLCAYDADEWIRITPGTGGALALGLAAILLARNPDALPTTSCKNVDELRALLATFPLDRTIALTGASEDTILRLATELWDQRPAIAVVDERSLAFANGVDTARAAMALNAVLGGFWQDGGVRVAPTAPLRDWPVVEQDAIARAGLARPRLDRAGTPEFPRAHALHETLPDAFLDPARQPMIAMLHHANPAYARIQPARWRQALAAIPRIVSFSPYLDETVDEFAHLVLPDATYLERWDLTIPAPAIDRAVVGVRVPTIVPLHDTRPSADVVLGLAKQIGGAVAAAMPWRIWRDACTDRLIGLMDTRRGSIAAMDVHDLLEHLHADGFWVDDAPAPTSPPVITLPTAWAEPTWDGDPARFPLGLLVYRPLGYAEGSGANQPWLRTLISRPDGRVWGFTARVNPESVPGLTHGAIVSVESAHGRIDATLALDERMLPGYVAVPMGAGHTAFGRWAKDFGANVLDLVRPGPAPGSGVNALCTTRVRISSGGAA